MFGLSNPLNAMQILFINILMDGMWLEINIRIVFYSVAFTRPAESITRCRSCRPGYNAKTTAKEGRTDYYPAPIIPSLVLSDDHRRGHSIHIPVRALRWPHVKARADDGNWHSSHTIQPCLIYRLTDIHVLRLPRSCVSNSKPWAWLRTHAKQNASHDRVGLLPSSAYSSIRAIYAGDLPNGGTPITGFVHVTSTRRDFDGIARGSPALRA